MTNAERWADSRVQFLIDCTKKDFDHGVAGKALVVRIVRRGINHVLHNLGQKFIHNNELKTYSNSVSSCEIIVQFLQRFGSLDIVANLSKLNAERLEWDVVKIEPAGGSNDYVLWLVR
jgi:hypothetical protein